MTSSDDRVAHVMVSLVGGALAVMGGSLLILTVVDGAGWMGGVFWQLIGASALTVIGGSAMFCYGIVRSPAEVAVDERGDARETSQKADQNGSKFEPLRSEDLTLADIPRPDADWLEISAFVRTIEPRKRIERAAQKRTEARVRLIHALRTELAWAQNSAKWGDGQFEQEPYELRLRNMIREMRVIMDIGELDHTLGQEVQKFLEEEHAEPDLEMFLISVARLAENELNAEAFVVYLGEYGGASRSIFRITTQPWSMSCISNERVRDY